MITKKVISVKESKAFFDAKINTLEEAMGVCVVNSKTKEFSFDQNAVNIICDDRLFAEEIYPLDYPGISTKFIEFIKMALEQKIKADTKYTHYCGNKKLHIKLKRINSDIVHFYIIDFIKMMETEIEMTKLNNIMESGDPIFTVCTWWIDYDEHFDNFKQSPSGPKLLGINIPKDGLYNTIEFSAVREKAAAKSPFYYECIKTEKEMYEKVRNNQTDYFGGRTPAYTKNNKEIWVESYGKCLIRYPDGSPRMFVAVDIYLSDLLENSNNATQLYHLIDDGLTNSEIGVWYYHKYHEEGKYYFTESWRKLMGISLEIEDSEVTAAYYKLISRVLEIDSNYKVHFDNHSKQVLEMLEGKIDKYSIVIPNLTADNRIQWIEIRSRVIEKDDKGEVRRFIGVNVDITDSFNRNIELERLRIENEHLNLAEQLAIKAGNVLVWYQDFNLISGKNQLFGNQIFSDKLGVVRDENGLITLKDLRRTIMKNDKESRRMSKEFLYNLNNIYTGKIKSFKDFLVKHENIITGEQMYFLHTVEVESQSENGEIQLIGGFMRDATESQKKQEEISFLANYDILTGLRNRNYFDSYINSGNIPNSYSVFLFDLDGLKLINDAFGHLEGDKAIKLVSQLISQAFNNNIFIARIGGDEFVALSESTNVEEITAAANVLEDLITEYNKTSIIEVNVSKGGYVVIDNDKTFERAFIHAENLMYRRKLGNRTSRKSKVLESILETLVAKTEETKEHSDRIADLCVKTLKGLGKTRGSDIEDILLLARVHDIGKITIPDYILNKPGKLTDEEYEIIKKHSEAGYKIINNITDSDFVSEAVLSHHERFDGNGYPQGLKGEEIPLFARIICVADSFDAMTSDRIYQKSKTNQEAIDEIKRCSGTQFDPKVVASFLKSCFTE